MSAANVSVCMIVRDEADCVYNALCSVAGLAQELCVVDTGSQDLTREIVRYFPHPGVRLVEFEWNDDFAAARNCSLALASQPWILVLDADEWLMVGHDKLIELYLQTHLDVGGFFLGVYSALTTRVEHCQQLRLFQNHSEIRYVGRSHAEVGSSIQRLGLSTAGGLPVGIIHEGYLPHHMAAKQKVERNLRIQRKQLAEEPDNPYLLFNFGQTCIQVGDLSAAEQYLSQAHQLAPPDAPYRARLAELQAAFKAAPGLVT